MNIISEIRMALMVHSVSWKPRNLNEPSIQAWHSLLQQTHITDTELSSLSILEDPGLDSEPSCNLYECHSCRDGVKDLSKSFLFSDKDEMGTEAEKLYVTLESAEAPCSWLLILLWVL